MTHAEVKARAHTIATGLVAGLWAGVGALYMWPKPVLYIGCASVLVVFTVVAYLAFFESVVSAHRDDSRRP